MFTNLLILFAGFILLIKGADFLVQGSASIARRFKVKTFVIGLTVVAFGTSAPELVVNLLSAGSGSADLAIGNIFGSNIANILLILGVTAIITSFKLGKGTIWKEIPFSLLAAILLVVLGSDVFLDGAAFDFLGRIDGIVLLFFFAIFLYYTFSISTATGETGEQIAVLPTWKSVTFVLFGLIGLTLGGKLIVDSAIEIASGLGISEHLIGLTIVALGTSLPELATAVIAAMKKHTDLVVGNIVGSNIFNIFFVLGTTATVSPMAYSGASMQDAFVLMVVSTILFLAMFIGKKQSLDRWQGVAFVAMYMLYIGMSVVRG